MLGKRISILAIYLFVMQLSFSQINNTGNISEREQIEKLLGDYTRSVNNMDTALTKNIWAINDSVSFIHPRGHEKGRNQVKDNFYIKTMHANFSERNLKIQDVAIRPYNDFAFVEFYWTFNAKRRKDGGPMTTRGRETQVLKKEKDGWKILHVHYSGMPVTGEGQGF